ncbi:YaiI/YqxD family protein [Pelagibius sp. Alg239-R121]|uniref:YaiI/YqxD family protein n=1 Tax=Pelagibius sp. Alg239-R121 TaxID=2993448 RepID=UPI002AC32D69|nr:YaiI/YqxD family protein [Pelagibius sp. Alg239-R121]
MEIYVDGDACPVKQEVLKVAERHGLIVHMVGNTWLRVGDSPLVKRVVVPEGPDAADDWIADHIGHGDVAITSDIPLADRCLKAGAGVLGPTGKPFTEDSIGMALAMRDLKATLRETGEISGAGPSFSKRDRSRFLSSLEDAIQAAKKQSKLAR